MAEMSRRYKALSASAQQVYVDKSKQALKEKQDAKAALLQQRRADARPPLAASAVAEQEPPGGSQAS